MNRITPFILTLLFILISGSIIASNTIKFERLSIEQGLSHSNVYCIFQDSRGLLWIGSEHLNLYDGYNFTIYKPDYKRPGGLGGSVISTFCEDSDGILWIGTWDGGLFRFNMEQNTFTPYKNDPKNTTSLSYNSVTTIVEGNKGELWVGTWGGGLNRFDKEKGTFQVYQNHKDKNDSLPSNLVYRILKDGLNNLWIGTDAGLCKLSLDNWGSNVKFEPVDLDRSNGENPELFSISALYEDGFGNFWIGTRNHGLIKMKPGGPENNMYLFTCFLDKQGISNRINSNYVTSVLEPVRGSGEIWVGTDNGLNIINSKSGSIRHYTSSPWDPLGLSSKVIRTLFCDRSGIVWVGTQGGGLNKLHCMGNKFTHFSSNSQDGNSLSYPNVLTIWEDQTGNLWAGTLGGGLNKIDRKNNRFTHFKHNPLDPKSIASDIIFSVIEDHRGFIWAGTYKHGISILDPNSETFTHLNADAGTKNSLSNNTLTQIFRGKKSKIWIGTYGNGLDCYNLVTRTFTNYDPKIADSQVSAESIIYCILEDSDGMIWFGSHEQGLYCLNPQTREFTHIPFSADNPAGLSGQSVFALMEDYQGVLWVGTERGLNKLDRKLRKVVDFTARNILKPFLIATILPDRAGNLWLGTTIGLLKVDPNKVKYQRFDPGDGLLNREFNPDACFGSPSGELFFGGIKGIDAFFPENITIRTIIPPIVITSFKINNLPVLPAVEQGSPLRKNILLAKEVFLSNGRNLITFDFAALDFCSPKKNQFAYKLQGLDKGYTFIGTRRFVQFLNLPPGNYILKVKGTNKDGVWNSIGTEIKVTVASRPWLKWWYGLGLFLLAILLIGLWRNKQRKEKHEWSESESVRLEKFYNKHKITEREKEIIELIARGKSNRDIEEVLFLSLKTIKNYTSNIYRKIGIKSRSQLIVLISDFLKQPKNNN